MKVILICTQKEFDQKRINQIQHYSKITWIKDDQVDITKVKELYDGEEKVLAFSPVSFNWITPKEIYNQIKNVKYICLTTTGYDYIDVEKCKLHKIKVTNVPHYSTNAVAEYAIFMMFSLSKKFPEQIKSNFKYEFSEELLMNEISTKSAGIVGLGHIGMRIADLTSRLGMKTYYWSRKTRNPKHKFLPIDQLLSTVDVLFPALPVSNDTSNFLNKSLLSKLRKESLVVDITHFEHGNKGITDREYLLKRIHENRLGGLAFESFSQKMDKQRGNIFITAPLAWYTDNSLENNIQIWADTIISCINGKPTNIIY